MKILVLCEIFIILLIGLQSENAVYSEETSTTPQQKETNTMTSSVKNESPSNQQPADPSANQTMVQPSTVSNNETLNTSIASFNAAIKSKSQQNDTDESVPNANESEEDATLKLSRLVEETKKSNHTSVATRIASKSYNNSFVLTTLLNLAHNKNESMIIGEPVDLTDFIEDMNFNTESIVFHGKITNFSNIRAAGVPSFGSVHSYYNNFTCTSQQIAMILSVIPENMTFKGDYVVQDSQKTNETSHGTFLFNQTGAKLLYKIPSISEFRTIGNSLQTHGDLIYDNGQVKFTQLCDKQCDLLASSAEMFNNIKSHMFEKFKESLISKPMNQFISTFPFLSTCSSASASKNHSKKYVINETFFLGKNTSARLRLGPMIIKGLDNFTFGNVVAIKSHLPKTPISFVISTQANNIQGHCDWHYFNGLSSHSIMNNTFTFIIEQIAFSINAKFSESKSWTVEDLKIHLDGISIHRLDKQCPKILTFIKIMLEDFVRDTIVNSLTGMFSQYFSEMVTTTTTTTESNTEKPKTTGTRTVVHWIPPRPMNKTDDITNTEDHLPLPRRVFPPCKDTRKWWQKLFYKNKCKNKVLDE